jgi:hypothetical protein
MPISNDLSVLARFVMLDHIANVKHDGLPSLETWCANSPQSASTETARPHSLVELDTDQLAVAFDTCLNAEG